MIEKNCRLEISKDKHVSDLEKEIRKKSGPIVIVATSFIKFILCGQNSEDRIFTYFNMMPNEDVIHIRILPNEYLEIFICIFIM